MRKVSKVLAIVVAFCCYSPGAIALSNSPLETTVCGFVTERLAFWSWRHAAGKPNPKAAADVPNAKAITFTTMDGRVLHGYKLAATSAAHKGTVLFAQGNAMLVDRLLKPLTFLSNSGFDVYLYDYRGYGESQGTARFKAILSDYRELAQTIRRDTHGKFFFYGISFGGIVLLNAADSIDMLAGIVIDSVPSKVSDDGCPAKYDSAENVPADARNILFIVGGKDHVVPRDESAALADKVRANGGRVEFRESFAHPFMDDRAVEHSRLLLVVSFLSGI